MGWQVIEELKDKEILICQPMIESRPGLVVFINEMRRSIRALFIAIVVVTGVVFFLTPQLLELVQAHLA
ncbi:MAG: hypothetical protein EX260_08430, partial [Desulfobulbaceae bacterium]